MGHFEIEGICKVEKGYEGGSLEFHFPEKTYSNLEEEYDNTYFDISSLVEKALGAEVSLEENTWPFRCNDISNEENQLEIADYRINNGRQYPPVYKVKFIVEAEEVSPEEAEIFWKEYEWDSSKNDCR